MFYNNVHNKRVEKMGGTFFYKNLLWLDKK